MTAPSAVDEAVARRRRDAHTAPLHRDAWCMGPSTTALEPEALVTSDGNRWSDPGQPTVYVAGDPGVAISEFGRHWSGESDDASVWAMRLHLEHAVDLRDAEVRGELGIPDSATWTLDRDRCRSVARDLRAGGACDGLIVPSAAFLDDETRWNAVIFVDRLSTPLSGALEVVGPTHSMTPADRSTS